MKKKKKKNRFKKIAVSAGNAGKPGSQSCDIPRELAIIQRAICFSVAYHIRVLHFLAMIKQMCKKEAA